MSGNDKIPVLDLKPQIRQLRSEFLGAMEAVLDSGGFIMGPTVKGFEEEVASYLGVEHAIGVNSGTDALVLGLRALGVGPGDEVVTTPFSFFATAESISAVGATPVFADIDPETFNIDPTTMAAAITDRTKAIIPVHLFGRPCEMDAIMAVAREHDVAVVEDTAQAFGGATESGKTGAIGTLGAFSFFPSKNLGAFGDGGLVTTNDAEMATSIRRLRAHGSLKKYMNEEIGYNSRLDAMQAAILRVKLPHIDAWNEGRRAAATRYGELLGGLDAVTAPPVVSGHVFHQYTVRVRGGQRDAVRAYMGEQGVSTMVYYPIPQDRLPVYIDQHPRCPHSDAAAAEVLSLPIWPEIEPEVQVRVCDTLRAALQAAGSSADVAATG